MPSHPAGRVVATPIALPMSLMLLVGALTYLVRWHLQPVVPSGLLAAERANRADVDGALALRGDAAGMELLVLADDDAPVAGAAVDCWSNWNDAGVPQRVVTDRDGKAALRLDQLACAPGEPLFVRVHDCAERLVFRGVVFADSLAVVRAAPLRHLLGRATGCEGAPLGTVRLFEEGQGLVDVPQFLGTCAVRDDGRFEWNGAFGAGALVYTAMWHGWALAAAVHRDGASAAIALDPVELSIHVAGDDGRGVAARVALRVAGDEGKADRALFTDGAGDATVLVPWRTWRSLQLSATADWCRAQVATPAVGTARVELRLPRAAAVATTIAGTVVDPSGDAIAGASIEVVDPERGSVFAGAAEADGTFSITVANAAQPYRLQVAKRAWVGAACAAVTDRRMRIVLHPAAALTVVPYGTNDDLVYRDGPGQYLAQDVRTGREYRGFATGEQTFESLPPSDYCVFVAFVNTGIYGIGHCALAVGDQRTLRVACSKGRKLAGRVTPALAGAQVLARAVELPRVVRQLWCHATTDAEGRFELPVFGMAAANVEVRHGALCAAAVLRLAADNAVAMTAAAGREAR